MSINTQVTNLFWKNMIRLTENQSTTLETFRAISAVIVVIAHSFQIFISGYHPKEFYYAGLFAQASVMMFFVLSGLLIGLSINNNISRNSGFFDVMSYAKSRLIRIYPPLIVSLIITIMLSFIVIYLFGVNSGYSSPHKYLQGHNFFFEAKEYLATITFTNMFTYRQVASNGALWSLPFEAWLYFVAGMIMLRTWMSVSIGIVLLILLSNANQNFIVFASVWGLSFALSPLAFSGSRIKVILTIALSSLSALIYFKLWHLSGISQKNDLYLYATLGFSFITIICLIMQLDVKIKVLYSIARSSYTLYLLHYPIIYFFSFLIWRLNINTKEAHHIAFFICPVAVIMFSHLTARFSENKDAFLSAMCGR